MFLGTTGTLLQYLLQCSNHCQDGRLDAQKNHRQHLLTLVPPRETRVHRRALRVLVHEPRYRFGPRIRVRARDVRIGTPHPMLLFVENRKGAVAPVEEEGVSGEWGVSGE